MAARRWLVSLCMCQLSSSFSKVRNSFPGDEVFPNLLVDVDEVISHVRREAKGSGIPKHHIDQHIPGMGKHVLKFIDAGALELVEEYSPAARRMVLVVSQESVDAFNENYITLGALSRNHGLHHRQVRSILSSLDIAPAYDPTEVGAFVFDRNAILRAERIDPRIWNIDVT